MEGLQTALPWIQIVLAVIVTALVLLQQSDQALGSAFGGGMSEAVSRTRRGSERVIFIACIVFSVLFILSAIAALLLQ